MPPSVAPQTQQPSASMSEGPNSRGNRQKLNDRKGLRLCGNSACVQRLAGFWARDDHAISLPISTSHVRLSVRRKHSFGFLIGGKTISPRDCLHELPDADQSDHPLYVVGKHVQRHLGAHVPPCVRKVVAPIGFGLTEFQVLRDGGGWLWNCGRRPARWATHQRCPRQAGRCAERIVHKSTAWLAVVNFPQGRYKRTSWLDTEKHSGNERSHGFCRRRAPQLMSWRTIRV